MRQPIYLWTALCFASAGCADPSVAMDASIDGAGDAQPADRSTSDGRDAQESGPDLDATLATDISVDAPPTDAGSEDDWRLAEGHYYEAFPWPDVSFESQTGEETAPFVIFPRPDAETEDYARHRWLHPAFDYQVPVALRGGAFPYHLEVDRTQTSSELLGGLRVGANFNSTEAYLVTIPASTIHELTPGVAYAVVLRAIDQTGKMLRVFWSVQREGAPLDRFFFADSSAEPGGDGTFERPFDTIQEPGWLAAGDGANSAQKTLVIREGRSLETPYEKAAGWNFTPERFPSAIIAIPGERPVIDCGGRSPLWGWGSAQSNDGFFWGLRGINGRRVYDTDWHGAFAAEFGNAWNRALVGNLELVVNARLAPNGVNPSVFNFNNVGTTPREHIAFINIEASDLEGAAIPNGGGLIDMNGWRYALVDNITLRRWGTSDSASHVVFSKRDISNVTIRRLTCVDGCNLGDNAMVDFRADNRPGQQNFENVEVTRSVWNAPSRHGVAWLRPSANLTGADGPFFAYFNTSRGTLTSMISLQRSSAETVVFAHNVGDRTFDVDGVLPTAFGGATPTARLENNDVELDAASFNADGTLRDEYLASQGRSRGTLGHEIR
ncbi:MAG: hypothetical protein AAF938_02465 [Myxococcota bacterium]